MNALEPTAHDVVILGGGLAGLTLALQLRQRCAGIDVLVLERRSHPVPHAAFKVGESSVEIGAHYFSAVLGLSAHLEQAQLRKFGFRFFFSEGQRDIGAVLELGASRALTVPTYQIDRGIFENFLGGEARRRGVRFLDGARVSGVDLALPAPLAPLATDVANRVTNRTDQGHSHGLHRVRFDHAGATREVSARWVVDAGGRAGLLKRQLGLAADNAHAVGAVWFRLKHRINVDTWSDDPAWRTRCDPATRWLSTNHLVGAGYWVWLIPLASGSHSVGIVADPRLHPLATMNSFDKAMQWLSIWQPRLFDELDSKRHLLQDFAYLRRFSHGCQQVFSAQRWALTGEAGVFLDPFYSPGSDFIAISNTYITELIGRDRAGQPIGAHAKVYEQLFQSFYANTLALYTDQYALFGDAVVLPVKVIWDYTFYWGVLAQLFFQNRLADLGALARLHDALALCQQLNGMVQDLLRAWSAQRRVSACVHATAGPSAAAGGVGPRAAMLDQAALAWFVELNRSLTDTLDDAQFQARLGASAQLLRALGAEVVERALHDCPALDGVAWRARLAGCGSFGAAALDRSAAAASPALLALLI